jgi:hypothetical protein
LRSERRLEVGSGGSSRVHGVALPFPPFSPAIFEPNL